MREYETVEEKNKPTRCQNEKLAEYKFIVLFMKESSGCQATQSNSVFFFLLFHNTEGSKEK